MKRKFTSRFPIVFAVVFLGFGCAVAVYAQNAPDADEYSVYTALLQQEFIGSKTKELVIEKQTNLYDSWEKDSVSMREELPSLTADTLKEFISRNEKPVELTNKFNLKIKINLVGEELYQIFAGGAQENPKTDGWAIFRQKYPTAGAIITLSRVGFNKEKSQALIYVGYQCDWLCGEGNYILLTKKDKVWKIEKKTMLWVS